MSKENKSLAQKIVDKYAEVDTLPDGYHIVTVDIIGHKRGYTKLEKQDVIVNKEGLTEEQMVPVKTSKKEALDLAVKDIAAQLDDGSIVLSDTFADQHLEGVKDLTDKNDKQ